MTFKNLWDKMCRATPEGWRLELVVSIGSRWSAPSDSCAPHWVARIAPSGSKEYVVAGKKMIGLKKSWHIDGRSAIDVWNKFLPAVRRMQELQQFKPVDPPEPTVPQWP